MNTKVLLTCAHLLIFSLASIAQNLVTPIQVKPTTDFENIWSEKIFSDSLSTSVIIWVKKSVRLHKHVEHTEHVYVLEGSADMQIGNEKMSIVKGDLLIIPKNTPHSLTVTSREALKVISFQSPQFLGKDRVFLDEKP